MNTSEDKVVYGFIFTFFVLMSGIDDSYRAIRIVETGYDQKNAVL